ncbi:MAG: DinB family protein [Flavisolibacter sp.]
MKEILLQLSAYHIWANQLLLNAIEHLPEEKQKQEVSSSFSSIFKTVLHMWSAESIWWQRMKLLERINIPAETFNGDMKELIVSALQQNRQWSEWISNAPEHHLEHVFQYQNSKREQFKQPIFQMLLHLFNHGTYHRGQLVNILRQLGVEKIPPTDFIVWSRSKYKAPSSVSSLR